MELTSEEIIAIIENKSEELQQSYNQWSNQWVNAIPNSEISKTAEHQRRMVKEQLTTLRLLLKDIEKENGKKKRRANNS